jgi:hypothetical protein
MSIGFSIEIENDIINKKKREEKKTSAEIHAKFTMIFYFKHDFIVAGI